MRIELSEEESLLRLTKSCEAISCVKGRLWVTTSNHGNDIVLRQGETLNVAQLDNVLVESLGQTEIAVLTEWH